MSQRNLLLAVKKLDEWNERHRAAVVDLHKRLSLIEAKDSARAKLEAGLQGSFVARLRWLLRGTVSHQG